MAHDVVHVPLHWSVDTETLNKENHTKEPVKTQRTVNTRNIASSNNLQEVYR